MGMRARAFLFWLLFRSAVEALMHELSSLDHLSTYAAVSHKVWASQG